MLGGCLEREGSGGTFGPPLYSTIMHAERPACAGREFFFFSARALYAPSGNPREEGDARQRRT